MTKNTAHAFNFSPKHNTHILTSPLIFKYRQFLPAESTLKQHSAQLLCTSGKILCTDIFQVPI